MWKTWGHDVDALHPACEIVLHHVKMLSHRSIDPNGYSVHFKGTWSFDLCKVVF